MLFTLGDPEIYDPIIERDGRIIKVGSDGNYLGGIVFDNLKQARKESQNTGFDIYILETSLENIKDRILVKMTVTYARDDYHNYELIKLDDWNKFKELLQQYDIGKVPIGEIAGKHSDVWINWKNPSFFQEITDQDQILSFYRNYRFYDSNTDGQFIFATEAFIEENF